MNEEAAIAEPVRYRAFISYSHADAKFAHWLHRKLESWRLPDQRRLTPVFIDRAELAAGSDLSAQVRQALGESAALVVVASPSARASRWVGQEIELFRALHPDRPVLAALIAGEPAEAFPPALVEAGDRELEPLAADFRQGHDGKRLGLLKLAAGLTALPLDRLVQRDAQARQRRVMAVTAGALALVLVLSVALVVALRARAEAERQRAEAEGLVEFMLTDLRDKLKGVGRLDVMDAVNQRAMAYYGDQADLDFLPADSLDRRARVIEAMGQDDESHGRINAAYEKYSEYDRIVSALLTKAPARTERIFAKARSENRLALIETTRGNVSAALLRFEHAATLLAQLPDEPDKREWLKLRSLVAGNLCAITLKKKSGATSAAENCTKAIALTKARQKLDPGDKSASYDLAFHYLWLGAAREAQGDIKAAEQARRDGFAVSDRLVSEEPNNMFWREQHMEVAFVLARSACVHGNFDTCFAFKKIALSDNKILILRDSSNSYWANYKYKLLAIEEGAANEQH